MLHRTKLACALSALAVLASCGPQITVTPPLVSASPPTPTKLRVLYRVLYSGTDRMTSVDFGERNAYPFDGEMYYVSDQPGSGRTPLNRYFNAGGFGQPISRVTQVFGSGGPRAFQIAARVSF